MRTISEPLPAVFGERTPVTVPFVLLLAGVALAVWDATLWSSVFAKETTAASAPTATTVTVTPTVVPLPATPEPTVAPVPAVVRAVADPPKPTLAPAAEPRDCPPLFTIAFDLGSAAPQFEETSLAALVEWLLSHPDTTLVVDGHSDSLGTPAINLALSQRRAGQMVKRFLAAGLPRDRITQRAFGNYNPVVGSREDAPQNRRVVLSVAGLKNCPESP